MAFATKTVAQRLSAIISGLSGVGGAQLGVPESISTRVYGMVTASGQTITSKTTGTIRRQARYNCTLAYRMDGGEAAAEEAMMDILDAFLDALYADRTLGGRCKDISVDATLADTPEYQIRVGKEFREYPVIVTVVQDDSYTVNP